MPQTESANHTTISVDVILCFRNYSKIMKWRREIEKLN